MVEPISSFAISIAAGIALNVYSTLQNTVDKQINKAFETALNDWCPNKIIREAKKEELKNHFSSIVFTSEYLLDNYKYYGEYSSFYISFNKRLVQYQAAYNYLNSIKDTMIFKELQMTTNDTNKKITEIFEYITSLKKKNDAENILNKKLCPVRKVLFNNYTKDVEAFYFERNIDKYFRDSLETGNLWIYGFSGIGKTALINRNLIYDSVEYVYCDFSPIDITSSQDVLNEIIYTIAEKYSISSQYTLDNLIKKTCDLLSQIDTKEIVIVIDELSIDNQSLLKEITEQFVKLLNYHCHKSSYSCLRFIASTINEPIFDRTFIGKAMEYFDFIKINDWTVDLAGLLDLLENSLCIGLNESMQSIILQNSQSSPRLLKKILRKLNLLDSICIEIVQEVSETTKKEYF